MILLAQRLISFRWPFSLLLILAALLLCAQADPVEVY